jgi:hypothetical protein
VKQFSQEPESRLTQESVKLMLIGSSSVITSMIYTLHLHRLAEVNDWSKPQPTKNPNSPSEVVSVLIKRVSVSPDLQQLQDVEVPRNWAMFEPGGNEAVSQMMLEVKAALKSRSPVAARTLLLERMNDIGKEYEEVYDTVVRETILFHLNQWANAVPGLNVDLDYWL